MNKLMSNAVVLKYILNYLSIDRVTPYYLDLKKKRTILDLQN